MGALLSSWSNIIWLFGYWIQSWWSGIDSNVKFIQQVGR